MQCQNGKLESRSAVTVTKEAKALQTVSYFGENNVTIREGNGDQHYENKIQVVIKWNIPEVAHTIWGLKRRVRIKLYILCTNIHYVSNAV